MITPEEIEQSYVYKIVKRILLKNYKWIKDVELDKQDFNQYKYTNFITLTIDPFELAKEKGWSVARWIRTGEPYYSSILGLFFNGQNEEFSKTSEEINNLMDDITRSSVIPEDLRLKKPKDSFSVSTFIS